MRNLKKFLALVLAMMMTLSLMVTVNAAEDKKAFSDGVTKEFTEAVEVLNGMKVFQGYEDGQFHPEKNITRAQVAAIVYRLATGDAEGDQAHLYVGGASKFQDVKDTAWYAGEVGFCANTGLVLGYSDTKFGPNDNVTGVQALAMILRAVGYGQAGEFKGPNWSTNVYSRARTEKMLGNVDKTTYTSKLSQPATRELVAELLFQAAQMPTVTWTQGLGYNKYTTPLGMEQDEDGKAKENPSLGEKYFGLTNYTGIIVGNQETGEDDTIIAMTGNTIKYIDSAGKAAEAKVPDSMAYTYPGKGVVVKIADTQAGSGNSSNKNWVANESLNVDAKTGLELFGHKVKVWYDGDDHAYAVIDKAAKSAIIYAPAESDMFDLTDDTKSIAKAAKAAGFKPTAKNTTDVHWSAEYSQFSSTAMASENDDISPISMYAVIDNTGKGGIDAIIRLNAEVAKITHTDTTVKPQTLTFGYEAGKTNLNKKASGFTGKDTGVLYTEADAANDIIQQVLPGSVTKLGEVVTAWQVAGSSAEYSKETRTAADTDMFTLKQKFTEVTGTVSSYKVADSKVVSVTLTNGTKIERSGILEGEQDIAYYADKGKNANTMSAGVTYTFKLDELGRFVNISEPNEFKFFYATYADFEYGAMGTGDINYKLYGVDWDGKNVNDRDLTFLKVGADPDNDEYGPNKDANHQLGIAYNDVLPITSKSMTTNSVLPGLNVAFMLNDKGEMKVPVNDGSIRFQNKANGNTGAQTWTITSQNAANGFAKVTNLQGESADDQIDYMLTNDTVFYVVTGFGVNATVKTYTGLKELVGSGTSVTISADDTDSKWTDEVWFQVGDYKYDSVDTGNNRTITKVILSDTNLRSFDAANLYYADEDAVDSTTKVTGLPTGIEPEHIKHVGLWNNGVKADYFLVVDGDLKGGDPTQDDEDAMFYTLTKVGEANGLPLYAATAVGSDPDDIPKMERPGNGGVCQAGETIKYTYVMVNNYSKASIGAAGSEDIFDVANAKVADIEFKNAADAGTPITDRGEIDSVQKLNNAVSTGHEVTVAIVNNGLNASVIYVISVS